MPLKIQKRHHPLSGKCYLREYHFKAGKHLALEQPMGIVFRLAFRIALRTKDDHSSTPYDQSVIVDSTSVLVSLAT